MVKYLTISQEDAVRLVNGEDVEIKIGKRIKRRLTIKTDYEIELEKIEREYKYKINKIKEICSKIEPEEGAQDVRQ